MAYWADGTPERQAVHIGITAADSHIHARQTTYRIAGPWVELSLLLIAGVICDGSSAGVVQIKGLSDRSMASAGAMQGISAAWRMQAGAPVRTSDNFCVVSDTRAAVALTFTNSHGASNDGQSWVARNPAGVPFDYLQFVSNADSTGDVQVSRPGQSTFVLAAARTVSGSDCGNGNVTKSVAPTSGHVPAGIGNFTDVVTLVASPI